MTQAECRAVIYNMNARRGSENRVNGEQFEFRVLRRFKRRSDVLFAIRSAGSHSIVDILVQFKSGKQIWITCKKDGYMTPRERKEIEQAGQVKPDNVEIRMYYYKSAKRMSYRTIV